jgi:hypothetical protein
MRLVAIVLLFCTAYLVDQQYFHGTYLAAIHRWVVNYR